MMDFHRLLRRQIKKLGLDQEHISKIQALLEMVDLAYRNFDQDLLHLENILELSSQELFRANKKLKEDVRMKELEVVKINRQLDRVMNNIREVIFQTDLKGNWIYLNDAWEEISGYKVHDSLGTNYRDYLKSVIKEDRKKLTELLAKRFSETTAVFRFAHKENKIRWIELRIKISRDPHGTIDGTIGAMVDITSLKETENELIKAKEIAIKASQAKNEFLSNMSHEIRTPMNAVIGMSNILLMNEPKPDQKDNLIALRHSSEHLLALINDILDFSKIEAGKVEFDNSEFNLLDLLDNLKNTYGYSAKIKGIRLILKKDDQLPDKIIGDRTRLTQILTNLLSNAIKFTSEGRVVLDVELLERSGEEVLLRFEVRDTGIGIHEDKLDRIFKRFAQADTTTSTDFGGTGLGLTICKKLLELQASKLHVTSEPGRGSTFYFDLKFGRSDELQTENQELNLFKSFDGIKGMKVLLVEDNKFNVLVVEELMSNWAVYLDVAENGEDAIDMIQQKEYQVVLMDIRMPLMDGYTTTQIIRKLPGGNFKNIPIIACTASYRKDVIDDIRRAGMTDYLSKPYRPDDLHDMLKKYSSGIE